MEEAILNIKTEERYISSMTLAVDPKDYDYVRVRMIEFHKELDKYLSRDTAELKEVYLVNLAFVPLSTRRG